MIRRLAAVLTVVLAIAAPEAAAQAPASPAPKVTVSHGLTLLGALKYGPDFRHVDYVRPDAPKGGAVRLHAIGSFDSFNPFIIKGDAADGLGLIFESLMGSILDDPSAEYGLIAKSVEVPDDLSFVVYNLRPEARFHDGTPITAADVVYSLETLKAQGAPHYRFYYANIVRAVAETPHRVKFEFTGPPNRELPQITGQLPILSKAYWSAREFDKTTLEPPLGSGPYRLASFEPGRHVTYERVRDYWGARLPINVGQNNFDTIRYDFYRDDTVALEAFKAGEYDYRLENSAKTWATGYDFPAFRDGQVIKRDFVHQRPTGMQSFAFNLRRDKFQDRRVREALAYALDFEWSNKNLFFDQYERTTSYFSNSELAATGLPSPAELALLEPFRGKIPDAVFTTAFEVPKTDGSGNMRDSLLKAQLLLRQAGWEVKNNVLTETRTGRPLEIEFLLVSPLFERIVAPLTNNLRRLGVQSRIRTVDPAQYQNRVREFDFDVIVASFAQSISPGNEQRDFWSAAAADRQGSRNVIGIKDPAIDALIEAIIAAPDRARLIAASRALDRVLLWNHFVIPQWHIRTDRVAYWNKFGTPEKQPGYGPGLFTWWVDPEKAAALDRRRA
ncbi:MAG: ABC transporter substrate-binding protein, partial [Alphaproteobacteria bacterium]|nr:ABC transporter substrate-binding protein [Alphaproteobacteria bacterium]